MCKCTPEVRTPFCGKPGCEPPANVVQLDRERENRTPHLAGRARCIACGHMWAAVAPVGTWQLECPTCKTLRGVWFAPCIGSEGEPFWACHCGCDVFVLTQRSLICTACGERKTGWYLGQDPDPPRPPPRNAA